MNISELIATSLSLSPSLSPSLSFGCFISQGLSMFTGLRSLQLPRARRHGETKPVVVKTERFNYSNLESVV
jgi:hypothetical protein